MAAGMASRFGAPGSKQTAALGPDGQMLMEYSVHDAALAGFDKFIFIISPGMRETFPQLIRSRINHGQLFFAEQNFDSLPQWYQHPVSRTKPYGTTAAVISARNLINEPFAVINADDFYGRQAFFDLSAALDRLENTGEVCMLTYPLISTLSPVGSVTRGLCQISEEGVLTGITETKGICLDSSSRPCIRTVGGDELPLPENAPVSMNIFGFRPWMMDTMAEDFERFLRSLDETDRMIAEYPIPVFLDQLMASGQLTIKAQPTNSCWFGITYQEDADAVRRHLASLSTDYQN